MTERSIPLFRSSPDWMSGELEMYRFRWKHRIKVDRHSEERQRRRNLLWPGRRFLRCARNNNASRVSTDLYTPSANSQPRLLWACHHPPPTTPAETLLNTCGARPYSDDLILPRDKSTNHPMTTVILSGKIRATRSKEMEGNQERGKALCLSEIV